MDNANAYGRLEAVSGSAMTPEGAGVALGGVEPNAPPPPMSRPLCVTMDEMTSIRFDNGTFWTIILTMFLPFPFVFKLWKCFEKSPGVMFEILHLALVAYPFLLYTIFTYYRQDGVEGIRWQSEIFFPVFHYLVVSVLLATYHSYRNVTQLVNVSGTRKDGSGPVISDEQWEALCRAGEFLEYHNVFDSEEAITEQESEDFKTEVVMKMLTSSRLLALLHPCISPTYYYLTTGSPFLSTPTEKYVIISTMIITHLLIAEYMLMGIRGILLYRYRVKSLDKFTQLSAMSIPENPFQLQYAEGVQFWLDTRFIVLRHDLKRITAVQAVVGGLTMLALGGAGLMLLETATGIGSLRYFESIDKIRIGLDYLFYASVVLQLSWMSMSMTYLQQSHTGVLGLKRYELSLMENSGGEISNNKTITLLSQIISYMDQHDDRPHLLGHKQTPVVFQVLMFACVLSLALTSSAFYDPDPAFTNYMQLSSSPSPLAP